MSSPFAEFEAKLVEGDFTAIASAIVHAYPDKQVLYALLAREWGVRISDVVFTDQAGALAVEELVAWAKAQGRALDLLAVTWEDRRREMEPLDALAQRFLPPADEKSQQKKQSTPGAISQALTDALSTQSLETRGFEAIQERIVEAPDARGAFDKFASALCRIEVGETYSATAMLIGRRTVLTSYSVAANAIKRRLTGDRVRAVFDRTHDADPLTLTGAVGGEWLGPYSPYAPGDARMPEAEEGEADLLNFTIIRLSEDVPPTRTPLELPQRAPIVPPGDAIVVLHHARAEPMKAALGVLTSYTKRGARVSYAVETAPGSAGAPVFTLDGELIAMHHAARFADGGWRFGQGVPIWRIQQAIVAAGLDPDEL